MSPPTLSDLPPPPPGKTGWPWTLETKRLPDAMPDGKPWPRISIVTPNYNYGQFIEETIRSVLLQGYPDLEYIVIDGGSTDDSVEIIKKYEKWITYWESECDRGQSNAINKGFSRATGGVYAWLNSDDIYNPGALLSAGKYFAGEKICHFLTGDVEFVHSMTEKVLMNKRAGPYSFKQLMEYHKGMYLPQPSVFFSETAYKELGGINRELSYAMDLDFWLRLRLIYPLHYLPGSLSKLRQHEGAKTLRDNEDAMGEVVGVVRRYLPELAGLDRLKLRVGSSMFLSTAICMQGYKHYFGNDRALALGSLKRAITTNALFSFHPLALKLALRLFMPDWMKQKLFNAP